MLGFRPSCWVLGLAADLVVALIRSLQSENAGSLQAYSRSNPGPPELCHVVTAPDARFVCGVSHVLLRILPGSRSPGMFAPFEALIQYPQANAEDRQQGQQG